MIEQVSLFRKEVEDEFSQENFVRLQSYLNNHTLLKGEFKFFEFFFDAAVTNKQITHKLPFVPKDVLTLHVSNGATVTWNYDTFTATYVDVTTSGSCTLRAFIGRYEE